ncbi:sulfate transporter CysZ [Teredinibacter haidensis]|uniref:sulfate transporter CysZ n=1 Tax=Teredinibacter haidensis TaxID=2731755 RepID=UPI0009491440|nr:sulfate transporter CysZ [Teredinibacter haidensis]
MPRNNLITGANYFFEGVKLLWHPQLRAYTLVPLVVNIILFAILTSVLISYLGMFSDGFAIEVTDWLRPAVDFLLALLGVILVALILIIYAYSFNVITNLIAAPFYGLLAEKAEEILSGKKPPPEPLSHMIPRVLKREIKKLLYFIFRGLLVMLIMLLIGLVIPFGGFLAPLIGLGWSAWCMTIQYADYPADNNRCSFTRVRTKLSSSLYSSFGFGGMITACSVIPILNIFAMPAAVTGGTIFWLNELSDESAE